MNQALVKIFPQRTLESIKSKRKQQAYRHIVSDLYQKSLDSSDGPSTECGQACATSENSYMTAIAEYIESLPRPSNEAYNLPRLMQICNSLGRKDQAEILQDLTLYLRETFPPKARKNKYLVANDVVLSRKQIRRAEYARTQDLWRKNRNKCLRMILDDISGVQVPPKGVMLPFWEEVMKGGENTSPGMSGSQQNIDGLWASITLKETREALPSNTTSAGPDGVSARLLKRIPHLTLCRILNLVAWCGKAPTHLLDSITTLIPKKSGVNKPADFRPITVSSVIIRTLHKVLATRMSRQIQFDQRQRAFRPTDGCSDNVFLLDLILRYHHKQHKSLYVASLDIAKAFDSVSHTTINETKDYGLTYSDDGLCDGCVCEKHH